MGRVWFACRLALFGSVVLWVTLWLHVVWVFGISAGYLDGGVFPMTPSVPVTLWRLALDCAVPAVLYALPAALLALVARPALVQAGLAGLWASVWLLAASGFATGFAIDHGTTWGLFEPFFALFYHRLLTPLLFCGGLLVVLWRADAGAVRPA